MDKFRFGELGWDQITEFPVLGSTEIWEFANETQDTHPIHIHLVQFQVLDRGPFHLDSSGVAVPDGPRTPPQPEEAGWKDTAKVPPGTMLRVIMRFTGYLGNYVFHCHMLEHEDNDMMRQFTVVPPGGHAPVTASAVAEPARLWPPDLAMAPVKIEGVRDENGNPVSIHVTGVTQDEPISHRAQDMEATPASGAGTAISLTGMGHDAMTMDALRDPCVDAVVDAHGQLYLRRERQDGGNGRVYRVAFTAVSRDGGTSGGSVLVAVPAREGVQLARNDGQTYSSLEDCVSTAEHDHMAHAAPSTVPTFTTSLGVLGIPGFTVYE
jgi:hypothetical protein